MKVMRKKEVPKWQGRCAFLQVPTQGKAGPSRQAVGTRDAAP